VLLLGRVAFAVLVYKYPREDTACTVIRFV
jgi:hypothetical protein